MLARFLIPAKIKKGVSLFKMNEVERSNPLSFLSNTDLFEGGSDSNEPVPQDNDAVSQDAPTPHDTHDGSLPDDTVSRDAKVTRKTCLSTKERKPRKLAKGELLKMHSESQRMVRESQVCLPSYQPKLKTLDSFLIKLKSRTPNSVLRKAMPKTLPSHSSFDHTDDVGDTSGDHAGDIGDDTGDTGDTFDHTKSRDHTGDHGGDTRSTDDTGDTTTDHIEPTMQASPWQQASLEQSQDFELRYCDDSQQPLPRQPSPQQQEPKLPLQTTPTLCTSERWMNDSDNLTPLELFQRKVLRQSLVTTPLSKTIDSKDSLQLSVKQQGSVRELSKTIKSQLSKKRFEEYKRREEDRKLKDEMLGDDELSKLEEKLIYEEEYDISEDEGSYHDNDSDDKLKRTSENSSHHGDSNQGDDCEGSDGYDSDVEDGYHGDSEDGYHGDSDDAVVKRSRKTIRIIDSDDEVSDNEPHPSTLTPPVSDEPHPLTPPMSDELHVLTLPVSDPLTLPIDASHDDTTQSIDSAPSPVDGCGPSPVDMSHYLSENAVLEHNGDQDDQLLNPVVATGNPVAVAGSEETRFSGNISCLSDKDLLSDFGPLTLTRSQLPVVVDEETQFLDSNGFLCVRDRPLHTVKSAISDLMEDTPTSVSHGSDVSKLCSGVFSTQTGTGMGLDTGTGMGLGRTQDILALCSGVFPSTMDNTGLHGNNQDDSSEDEMPQLTKKHTRRPRARQTKGERLQEFVESEAELSGSDVGPEEESEGGEGEDEYVDEGGSDADLSDTELHDQVNEAHMKQVLADDKADIKIIKEKFLLEGDLYEDGMYMKNGFFRTRHFKHHGSETSMDLFSEDRNLDNLQECEVVMMDSQSEAKKRKERLEREEFIRKCRANSNNLLSFDENSQSILDIIQEASCPAKLNLSDVSNSNKPPSRRGSFLKHQPLTLKKLSTYTSATPHIKNNSRSFVFQTETPKTAPQQKAKVSNSEPHPKRPCYKRSFSLPQGQGSIFQKFQQ